MEYTHVFLVRQIIHCQESVYTLLRYPQNVFAHLCIPDILIIIIILL